MKINDRHFGPLQPRRGPSDSRGKEEPAEPAPVPPAERERSDRVDLSDAARKLARAVRHEIRDRRHPEPVDQPPGERTPAERAPGIHPPRETRRDVAEFSEAARKIARDVVHALPADARDRIQQVRQRVIGGAYDIDHVVSEVARRIIERGDL